MSRRFAAFFLARKFSRDKKCVVCAFAARILLRWKRDERINTPGKKNNDADDGENAICIRYDFH